MVIGRDKERGIFCIADGSEKNVLSSMNFWTYVALVAGPALFAVFFIAIDSIYLKMSLSQLAWPAAFLMYAYIIWTLSIEFYNGMVILKNNAQRARSNVDALLARRSSLVSNLLLVVKESAKYEKGVQGRIATIRAGAPGASKELFAIAESYPALAAAGNFRQLMEELSRTESWLAGARSYVADSIMLYNNRVSSFPYLLLAPVFGLKPLEQKAG